MSKNGRIKSLNDMKGNRVRMMFTTADAAAGVILIKHFGGEPYVVQSAGSVEQVTALMRGDIDLYFVSYTTGLKEIASSGGQLIPALVLRTDKRPELPNVPNLVDVGLQSEGSLWGAYRFIAAPVGLPADAQETLVAAIGKATKDPEFISRMEKGGYLPSTATPSEVKKIIEDTVSFFRKSQKEWEPLLRK
jgi:tripartite-type tricarboxylate transporter receptor subunit TctC